MSDLDLNAVATVARARWERTKLATVRPWDDLPEALRLRMIAQVNRDDVAAVVAQVREHVAAEIEAKRCHAVCGGLWRRGLDDAARIARGGAR